MPGVVLHVEHDIRMISRSPLLVSNFTGNDALFDTFMGFRQGSIPSSLRLASVFQILLPLTELFDMALRLNFFV